MLQENRRKQLDGIVGQMIAAKESDSSIQFVVDDFKKKYGDETVATQEAPKKDFLTKATDIATTIFPGTRAIGEGIGTAALNIGKLIKGESPDIPVDIPK